MANPNGNPIPYGLGDAFLDMYGGNLPDGGLGQDLLQGTEDIRFAPPATAAPGNPDPMLMHQAQTAYGETAGLYPQDLAGRTGVYNVSGWDPDSAAQLQAARQWIERVRLVNPKVHEASPDLSNGVQRSAWQRAMDAASGAATLEMPPGVSHFYMRQGATPLSAPKWARQMPIKTFGPFVNVGGSVAKGPDTYIDFFGGP